MKTIAGSIPEAGGYRDLASRADTDARVRDHFASRIDALRGKFAELKSAADDEGEEDMADDLDRIDARMERTALALRDADYTGTLFMRSLELPDSDLEKVCAYDLSLFEDVALLVKDVMALRYETIGNLTLREIEGTLAAIELRIANRKDILEGSGRA